MDALKGRPTDAWVLTDQCQVLLERELLVELLVALPVLEGGDLGNEGIGFAHVILPREVVLEV